jgi:hypothetical protein
MGNMVCSGATSFSVYEGQSAAAILQLNELAGIPVSRIVEAILMTGR